MNASNKYTGSGPINEHDNGNVEMLLLAIHVTSVIFTPGKLKHNSTAFKFAA